VAASAVDVKPEPQRHSRWLWVVLWLRRHRDVVIALTATGIALAFLLDLLIPGYAIAGFYLIPLMLVALALQGRTPIVLTGALCLTLTVTVMVVQERVTGQNILLVVFGALAGAGLIALGYLFNRFDRLYEREVITTERLHALTAQLQRLQEVSVLDSQRPLSELLFDVATRAAQLLSSDAARLYRLDADHDVLTLQAVAGRLAGTTGADHEQGAGIEEATSAATVAAQGAVETGDARLRPLGDDCLGRALRERRPILEGTCLAVPLAARDDIYGVIALSYPQPPRLWADDIWLAGAFADQATLAIENARLREQVERTAVAAERSRLARELHDSVTQSLFAASLNAESVLRERGALSPESRASLEDLERLTQGALAEMRALLLEMRPAALAQTPLADLLGHVVKAAAARATTSFTLRTTDACPLPGDVTVALYRIAQEATTNVVRHAAADSAWVELSAEPDGVRLVVGDDGCGFDQTKVGPQQFGLRTMRERAEAVEARLTLDAEPGRGTVVEVEWRAGG